MFTPSHLKAAKERRNLLKKVYHYRKASLTPQVQAELLSQIRSLEGLRRLPSATAKAQLPGLLSSSQKLLERVGGRYWRHYHLFDNVETLLVAAIVAIAIRAYFLQPFKIPTNSMWPTYHGMTYNIIPQAAPEPTALQRTAGAILQGSSYHEAIAPTSGQLTLPLFTLPERQAAQGVFRYREVQGRALGLFPVREREYTLMVDGTPVPIRVPWEFSLDKLLFEKFFPQGEGYGINNRGEAFTDLQVEAGAPILRFTIETGDMLFVDRFSYRWVFPQVGQPIVFRTRAVEGLTLLNGGQPDDRYYIKRLVGLPSDELQITATGTLLRNAQPISGSRIFQLNAEKHPPYRGYEQRYDFASGGQIRVPEGQYYAMGDNSPESLDSRAWGGLPRDQVIGRAVFIYYPFTKRWGFSR
jgi:signal peptidase I